MIIRENAARATIDKHNHWVYILADDTGTAFVQNELGYADASELPTTYIDDNMYFTFSPDMDEYNFAWQYAKEAKVEDFNKLAEKTLKDEGYKIWEDIKPRVDEYIATVDAKNTTTGNYVYNLIDELVEPFRYTSCECIGEDYYLNMLYAYEPFFNKLDETIHEDFDESNMSREELYDYDYGCDDCGTRVPENKITWFYGAEIGLCPECINNYTRDELDTIDKTGKLPNKTIEESATSDEGWDIYTLQKTLEVLTNKFSKAEGSLVTGFESERDLVKRLLKSHYKIVEVSDARKSETDESSWRIEYSGPKA